VAAARANGFQFVRLASDASECRLENATVVVSAPQNRDAHCRLRLFTGSPLRPGWTLARMIIEQNPESAQSDLRLLPSGWQLTMTVPAGRTGLFTIRRVKLRGSDCDRWRDAFE
jgi:hypothetical protein